MHCKYCLEDIEINIKNNKIYYPCACKNPVHMKCLDKWNDIRTSNCTKCEICNTDYKNNISYKCRSDVNIYKLYIYFSTICIVTIIYILLYEYKINIKDN